MIRTSPSNVRLLRQAMTPRHGVLRMKGTISRESQRARRSYLNVPSTDKRKLEESLRSYSDVIVYNLQEGVTNPNGKRARENLHKFLSIPRSPGQISLPKPGRVAVKISPARSPDFIEDVKILEHEGRISCVVLSNITSVNDFEMAVRAIWEHVRTGQIRLIASIECAYGVKNIREILAFCHKNRDYFDFSSILFEADNYRYNGSKIRAPCKLELDYARTKIVLLARKYGVEAIDMASSVNISQRQLWLECLQAQILGFSGKQARNLIQADVIDRTYMRYSRGYNSGANNEKQKCPSEHDHSKDSGVDKDNLISFPSEPLNTEGLNLSFEDVFLQYGA